MNALKYNNFNVIIARNLNSVPLCDALTAVTSSGTPCSPGRNKLYYVSLISIRRTETLDEWVGGIYIFKLCPIDFFRHQP